MLTRSLALRAMVAAGRTRCRETLDLLGDPTSVDWYMQLWIDLDVPQEILERVLDDAAATR